MKKSYGAEERCVVTGLGMESRSEMVQGQSFNYSVGKLTETVHMPRSVVQGSENGKHGEIGAQTEMEVDGLLLPHNSKHGTRVPFPLEEEAGDGFNAKLLAANRHSSGGSDSGGTKGRWNG